MDDNAKALAAETELKRFGALADEHVDKLEGLLEKAGSLTHVPGKGWDCDSSAVSLAISGREDHANIKTLTASDNRILSKVTLALTALSEEMEFLREEAESKFFDPLMFYGEGIPEEKVGDEGEAVVAISKLLETLQNLKCYSDHCNEVVLNALTQLGALYRNAVESVVVIDMTDSHQTVLLERLSELFRTLITLDDIIGNNMILQDHWAAFKRVINAAQLDHTKFGVDPKKLQLMRKLLTSTEAKVIHGNIFKAAIDHEFDKSLMVSNNLMLCDEIEYCVRKMLHDVDNASDVSNPGMRFVGSLGVLVLHNQLFLKLDRRIVTKTLELIKKIPNVTLYGGVMWFPEQFLNEHIPQMMQNVEKKQIQGLSQQRQLFLQSKAQSLQGELKTYHQQLKKWVIKIEATFKSPIHSLTLDHLTRVSDLLVQGLSMAFNVKENVTTVLNLHSKLSVPLTKSSVISICKMTEILKAIEHTFNRHSLYIVGVLPHICQHLVFSILTVIVKTKKNVISDKYYTQTKLDTLSALVMAENAVSGACTKRRLLVATTVLGFALDRTFGDEQRHVLSRSLARFSIISDFKNKVEQLCNTSFIYWHRIIVGTYFNTIYESKSDCYRLHFMFMALQDVFDPLCNVHHLEDARLLCDDFEAEIVGHLKDKILDPLCRDLETDLRLSAHSHLKLDDNNPFTSGLEDLSLFLRLDSIQFCNKVINIKAHVEAYLEKIFYNLTTVALHNWKTYGEMRALARHKYDAQTVDDHLPAQTLEQGLDILEIMRNINVFVSRYLYNLNNQIFIEFKSDNKHLNTINIRHVANSIRTHGTGIMNTTVNFTYQFLKKKFGMFSQFLYDDHIKSRLTKDLQFFRSNGEEMEQKYPFDRANKFNKGIRKLGTMPDGGTYLDHFRMLVTQIGNAMGYVRMIRSGGLHFVSNTIKFLPDVNEEDLPNFEKLAVEEQMSQEGIEAAKTLDDVVENLIKNFSDGNNYFQLLVNVFEKQFHDPRHVHLKKFFVIVPPLTVNYIDYMIHAKEKMSKKNQVGAAFTDDGLAMGIAYILRLLNQWEDFDSFHWFQSVRDMYAKELAEVEKQKTQVTDEKLKNTLTLTSNRLETYAREFQLLDYNLSSARIFFRFTQDDEKEDEEIEVQNVEEELKAEK